MDAANDGSVFIGFWRQDDTFGSPRPFVWTAVDGIIALPLSSVRALSDDGRVAVGANGQHAARWTKASGLVDLGSLPDARAEAVSHDGLNIAGDYMMVLSFGGLPSSRVFHWNDSSNAMRDLGSLGGENSSFSAMNADGTIIVGESDTIISHTGNNSHAFRWSSITGTMTDLGTLGSDYSRALAVSDDGHTVVGQSETSSGHTHVFHWDTHSESMTDLGTLGGNHSRFAAMTPDGSVVVGESEKTSDPSKSHAYRWTKTGGMIDLGNLGGVYSRAEAVSADGHVVAGRATNAANKLRVFRWSTTTSTMADLGTLGGNVASLGAMTPDGSVLVGTSSIDPINDDTTKAFRWTEKTSMQSVEAWLKESGVAVGPDLQTQSASMVSDDGSIVAGYLSNGNLFIAKGGSGLISQADIDESINAIAPAMNLQQEAANLVLNGAHGHPLSRRVDTHRLTAWVAGDYGSDNHGTRDGDISVAELGGGYNFGAAQANLAIGRTGAKQETFLGGEATLRGIYLVTDLILPLPHTAFVVTLTGFYQHSDLNIRRGYLNAGLPDSSEGSANADTIGGALRIDWEDAFAIKKIAFTPYLKSSTVRTKTEAFTETGGGFPASLDSRTDTVSDLTIGLNGNYTLTKNVRLVSTLEGIHRFQKEGSNVTGVVAGISNFSTQGEDYRQEWIRVSLGTEYSVGKGLVSVSLNATSQSSTSNVWLATSYQIQF